MPPRMTLCNYSHWWETPRAVVMSSRTNHKACKEVGLKGDLIFLNARLWASGLIPVQKHSKNAEACSVHGPLENKPGEMLISRMLSTG
jgi:hypothetical protein